jgi:hypothetical protein
MIICVDFDGTSVTHEFPKVGKDIGAVPVLKKLIENGHQLILFTMRSDIDNVSHKGIEIPNNLLTDAVNWFKDNGIELYGINTNPTQNSWTSSPKAYGNLFIDDASLGCPLKMDKNLSNRPFVNWIEVEKILIDMKLIK